MLRPAKVISFLIVVVLSAFMLATASNAGTLGTKASSNPCAMSLPVFDRIDKAQSEAAVAEVQQAIRSASQEAIEQLRTSKSETAKTYLIFLLGELHADEAVEVLIEMIDFETQGDSRRALGRWGGHPAIDALRRLSGPTAIAYILRALQTEQNELRKTLLAVALSECIGSDAAKFMIDRDMKEATEPGKIANLAKAIKVLGTPATKPTHRPE